MAEPQLSVRSAKARDLARRLARREHRSIADVVERALEAYEIREAGREPASAFYARLANDYGSDFDPAPFSFRTKAVVLSCRLYCSNSESEPVQLKLDMGGFA